MIGQMKPIKLNKYTVTQDGNGDNTEVLTDSYRIWAMVDDGGGSRSVNQGKTNLDHTRTFNVWFRNGFNLTTEWRIKYNGKEYAITNVERINEKRFNYRITGTTR